MSLWYNCCKYTCVLHIKCPKTSALIAISLIVLVVQGATDVNFSIQVSKRMFLLVKFFHSYCMWFTIRIQYYIKKDKNAVRLK